MAASAGSRRIVTLFFALALLHLLPVWRVEYIPTQDGASHLYNAQVLRELAAGTPEFTRVFKADLRPYPNWLTHVMLWLALYVAPPVVAEKLVFSAILLTFLIGCWTLAGAADERNRVYAFLAMPLAYHLLLQLGFYNYSMGVALVPFAIAACWRGKRTATAVWLLLCYFTHLLPAALAVAACGVLIVLRRRWRELVVLVPPAALMLWFFLQPTQPGGTWTWKGIWLWEPLARVALLFTFDERQLTFGTILGAAYALLIVATFVFERRRHDLLLLVAAMSVILYFAAPLSIEEGGVLKMRLLIFPYLLILPWLTPRLARWPVIIALSLVAVANVVFIRNCWKRVDKVFVQATAPFAHAEPLRSVVPLVFDRKTPYSHLPLLGHATSYGSTQRRLVNFGNYEGGMGFFPVAFRPDVPRPSIYSIEAGPEHFVPNAWLFDYVYTWKMPPGSAVEARLAERYRLVASEGEARLYARVAERVP